MVLATLAVVFGLGWGHLFRSLTFKIVMVGIVVCIRPEFPRSLGDSVAWFLWAAVRPEKLLKKRVYSGAFVKGILTTILATPCSGPLLIPAVTWAIAQPAWLTYLAFFFLGLGMASPYLLIGAFPKLVGFLPKPGAWMETFKQLMGFTLLATGIFLINAIEIQVSDADSGSDVDCRHRMLVGWAHSLRFATEQILDGLRTSIGTDSAGRLFFIQSFDSSNMNWNGCHFRMSPSKMNSQKET